MTAATVAPQTVAPRTSARILLDWGWAWSAAAMLVIGCAGITRPVIWRDELCSVTAADRSLPALWGMLQHVDAVSGFYYLLLHLWVSLLGDSLLAVRIPSALAMAGAAAFVALTGRALYGPRIGLGAGLLFAVLPATSRYAQEARGYALCVLGAAAGGWLLLRALHLPRWTRWCAYLGAMTVAGLANAVALALLAAHAAVVAAWWWRDRDRRVVRWLAAASGVVALTAPMMLLATRQRDGQLFWLTPPGLPQARELFPTLAGSSLVAGALIVLAVLSVTGSRRGSLFGVAGVLAPVAAVFLVSQVQPVWYPRYLLFVVPCLAVLACGATARLSAWATVAVVAAVALVGGHDQRAVRAPGAHTSGRYPYLSPQAPIRYDVLGRALHARARPGDARLFLAAEAHWQYETYLDWRYGHDQPRLVCRAGTAVQARRLLPTVAADTARCLGHSPRLWLVRAGRYDTAPLRGLPPAVAAPLGQRYRVVSARYVQGSTLILAVATGGPGTSDRPPR
ncbi:MAG TPA: glycosyltransferase family 39 protein [Actinocatenispora sp.]